MIAVRAHLFAAFCGLHLEASACNLGVFPYNCLSELAAYSGSFFAHCPFARAFCLQFKLLFAHNGKVRLGTYTDCEQNSSTESKKCSNCKAKKFPHFLLHLWFLTRIGSWSMHLWFSGYRPPRRDENRTIYLEVQICIVHSNRKLLRNSLSFLSLVVLFTNFKITKDFLSLPNAWQAWKKWENTHFSKEIPC